MSSRSRLFLLFCYVLVVYVSFFGVRPFSWPMSSDYLPLMKEYHFTFLMSFERTFFNTLSPFERSTDTTTAYLSRSSSIDDRGERGASHGIQDRRAHRQAGPL